MKAMILAAGLGTRLRPLTDDRPKALVEVAGRTLLEIALARLRDFGIHEVIVNVHHFAPVVTQYLQANQNFGMKIEISHEEILLDTGGGLKKAAWFFLQDAPGRETSEPFILHNVDVLSTIDLACMLRAHGKSRALATLAVQDRPTSRYLLFDAEGRLCGRRSGSATETGSIPSLPLPEALAFSGIHILSPHILPLLTEDGAFSIIDAYLRLAAEGVPILGFRADPYYWRDLGRPQDLAQAAEDFRAGRIMP